MKIRIKLFKVQGTVILQQLEVLKREGLPIGWAIITKAKILVR